MGIGRFILFLIIAVVLSVGINYLIISNAVDASEEKIVNQLNPIDRIASNCAPTGESYSSNDAPFVGKTGHQICADRGKGSCLIGLASIIGLEEESESSGIDGFYDCNERLENPGFDFPEGSEIVAKYICCS